jgi:site-specific recombinase XerD
MSLKVVKPAISLKALAEWRRQCLGDGLVFANPDTGKPFDNVNKAWDGILSLAKIDKFRWHDMRHHFASKLVMKGVDLNTVRELLGHADIKMTLRYAHLVPEHKVNAVAKLVEGE